MKCLICQKEYKSITNTHLKSHNITQEEYIKKFGNIRDEKTQKEISKKISNSLKGKNKSVEHIENLKRSFTNERKKNISKYMKENNPMYNKDTVMGVVRKNRDSGLYERHSENMLMKWKDGNFRNGVVERMKENNPMYNEDTVIKNAKSHNRKKSGIEILFEEMLDDENKKDIEYTGNNKIWINGKNPDYIIKNTNKLIEITSDAYYRTVETYDKKRIDIFEEKNYNCLCVWIMHIKKCDKEQFKEQLNRKIKEYKNGEYSGTWNFYDK